MDVKLVTQDRELLKMCREIVTNLPHQHCTFSVAASDDADAQAEADVFLWDFEPNMTRLPDVDDNPSKHLFLVHRNDLPLFRERIATAEARIFLKPARRATLEVFLAQALAAYQDREAATTSLRADRDEILQCLIETNLRLQEYDQERTTFLARAVHDFRAPLTALSGYCGLLLSEPLGPLSESQREVLRRMQHSAKRLSRMTSAMFQLSVGRQVKRLPDLRPGDMRECLEQALHEIIPFADEKGIAIRVELAACDHPLYFEAGQMEQVLINVLDNACKFTPRSGTIDIRGYPFFWERRISKSSLPPAAERRWRTTTEPNTYRIDIQDSGNAIPEEHLERIFEEYTSYAGGRDRSGGGLGLAITRLIVSQHDGAVWAENSDSGPMFSFVLPMHRREPLYSAEQLVEPVKEEQLSNARC
ncbi:MAG: HAMP domain-containing sensor histidine kinase [Bryobacteraceae bacterium]|jgi:signal transduction histidine kinase